MPLTAKSFEMFPRHKVYAFISASSALNRHIFLALTNNKMLFSLQCRLPQNLLFDLVRVIE